MAPLRRRAAAPGPIPPQTGPLALPQGGSGLPFLVTMESDGCAEKAFSGPLFARGYADRNMLSIVTTLFRLALRYGTCLSHPTSRLA